MTATTISIDEEVLGAGRARAKELKESGARRRYSFSAYVEELIEADAKHRILGPRYQAPYEEGGDPA